MAPSATLPLSITLPSIGHHYQNRQSSMPIWGFPFPQPFSPKAGRASLTRTPAKKLEEMPSHPLDSSLCSKWRKWQLLLHSRLWYPHHPGLTHLPKSYPHLNRYFSPTPEGALQKKLSQQSIPTRCTSVSFKPETESPCPLIYKTPPSAQPWYLRSAPFCWSIFSVQSH